MSEILARLLEQDENTELDFKQKIRLSTHSEKAEFAKDVSAFANTRGGHIIYGVEDNTKRPVGIDTQTFDETKMQQIVSTRCYPPVNFSARLIVFNERYFGLLTIPNSPLKPHQITQTREIFIRRGSTTDRATRDEIESMFDERRKRETKVRLPYDIFAKKAWGLKEVPENTRCLSIMTCPINPDASLFKLSRETRKKLSQLIPGDLGTFISYPTQYTWVLESVGKINSTPRRRIEIADNGLIAFLRVQDIDKSFVRLSNIGNWFSLFMEYANKIYDEVALYCEDIVLLVAVNKVEGKQLLTDDPRQKIALEKWQHCRRYSIKIIRNISLPVDIEKTFLDIAKEIKRCFGLD